MIGHTDKNSVPAAFFETAERLARGSACLSKAGSRWHSTSWLALKERVLAVSRGLMRQGLAPGDRVALMVNTRIEWTIADLAIMACGAVSVPVYCALPVERISHILQDSTPSMAIVEDSRVAGMFEEARRHGGIHTEMTLIGVERGAGRLSLEDLEVQGRAEGQAAEVIKTAEGLALEDPASYVYTSGTTGALKGVVVTHGMILAEVRAAAEVFRFKPGEVGLLALPLAHVLGRMIQFYHMLQGPTLAYAESLERLAENYLETRPHFVCGVPRMLEKIHEKVWQHIGRSPARTRRMAHWALKAGRELVVLNQRRRPVPTRLKAECFVADILLFRRLRRRLGGRLEWFICGGGRLSEDITKFFHACGIKVLEGYGLTETFAAITANRPDEYRFGTVGKPLPGVQIKLNQEGEIMVKGPMVFSEYLNLPAETAASFDAGGWFLTGDLGEYSRDGFLRITGRKKEMIVTSGGKNIAPQMIEEMLTASPGIAGAMVYGDGRKFLTALIVADPAERERLGESETRRLIEKHVEECNLRLARYETIKRFAIIDEEFTVAGGELTPTLKVRRDFVAEKYAELLEGLYR